MTHEAPKALALGSQIQLGKDDPLWELVEALEAHQGTGGEVWRHVNVAPGGELSAVLTSADGSLGTVRVAISVQVVGEVA
jgi:hypothetical protein